VSSSSRAELASSFGAAAGTYAEHRPDYATAAVEWALERAPGRRVLDLGAGTGKLTEGLSALGFDVVAVEPDAAMLSELREAAPGIRALQGRAEAIPLPDDSVDAVVAGNAMHWFDLDVAGPEMLRVLSAGGVVAGLWNLLDDSVDWVARLAQVGGPEVIGPRDLPNTWGAAIAAIHAPTSGAAPRFVEAEHEMFPHGQRRSADSLVATFSTKAGVLVLPTPEREARLTAIRSFLATRPETAQGDFVLPMVTAVLRMKRP
jgi:SAM-dependent methyltransferase